MNPACMIAMSLVLTQAQAVELVEQPHLTV